MSDKIKYKNVLDVLHNYMRLYIIDCKELSYNEINIEINIEINKEHMKVDHSYILRIIDYLRDKVCLVEKDYVRVSLEDVSVSKNVILTIKLEVLHGFNTYLHNLPKDVLLEICTKLTRQAQNSLIEVISSLTWEEVMIKIFPNYYKDLKDIKGEATWKSIYHSCSKLIFDLYRADRDVIFKEFFRGYPHFLYENDDNTSYQLLYAVFLKVYNPELFTYILSLKIPDLDWKILLRCLAQHLSESARQKHNDDFQIEDALYLEDISEILKISTNYDLYYIVICILIRYGDPSFISDITSPERNEEKKSEDRFITYGPQLLYQVYLYKRILIESLPKDKIKLLLTLADFEAYPLLRKYLERIS